MARLVGCETSEAEREEMIRLHCEEGLDLDECIEHILK